MSASHLPSLYIITDRTLIGGEQFLPALHSLMAEGGFMLQLREKDVSSRKLLTWAQTLSEWGNQFGVPVLINDRVDLVMVTGLQGVHLRSHSLPIAKARQCLGPHRLIGASVHSVEEARKGEQEGADFVVLGPIFETPSKREYGAPLGLHVLAEAVRVCRLPIFAIGGIDPSRVEPIKQAGAYGVAVISSIFQSSSPRDCVKHYSTLLGV